MCEKIGRLGEPTEGAGKNVANPDPPLQLEVPPFPHWWPPHLPCSQASRRRLGSATGLGLHRNERIQTVVTMLAGLSAGSAEILTYELHPTTGVLDRPP